MKDFITIISILLFILFVFLFSFFITIFKPIDFEKGVLTLQDRHYLKKQLIENNKKNIDYNTKWLDEEYENIHFH